MKKLMVIFAAVVGFNASASMVENYYADLNHFQFQPQSQLDQMTQGLVVTANVAITPISDITVNIFRKINCPEGLFCPAIAYLPITYTVSHPKRKIGHCKETIFTGKVDERRVDGAMTQITVIDNTTNTCKTFVALAPTVVILKTQGPREEAPERHVLSSDQVLHQLM